METTLQDLLTLDVDTLTAIIDNVTEAKKLYVKEKIVNPLQLLATALLPDGYAWLGEDLGAPFYNDLQTLLTAIAAGSAIGTSVDLIVNVYKQLAAGAVTITDNRSDTMYKSPSRDQFYIIVNLDPISTFLENQIFENITIKFASNSKIKNCKFFNCNLEGLSAGDVELTDTTVDRCNIRNMGTLNLIAGNSVFNSIIKSNINFIDTTSKLYNCVYSTIPTNETNNLTLTGNLHISNI